MSNDNENEYDNYNYEDEDFDNKSALKKKILLVVMLIIAIIIVIIVLKSCTKNSGNNEPPKKEEFSYEKTLLDAGKKYYEFNEHKMPVSVGECAVVDLATLSGTIETVRTTEFSTCDSNKTIVRVCKLETGGYQWTPWLDCTNKKSESEYDVEKEGTESNLKIDESFVTFKFLPQVLDSVNEDLGEVEEVWQDEITYDNYKTISTTKYYRYQDQAWIWNTTFKTYYTSLGDKSKASDVKEYYVSAPSSKYNQSEGSATAYKWYTITDEIKEYYKEDGEVAWKVASKAPSGYIKDENKVKVINVYATRSVSSTTKSNYYYACALSATDKENIIYQQVKCGNQNPAYKYQVSEGWSCPVGSSPSTTPVVNGTTCKVYSSWSNATTVSCGEASDTCRHGTITYNQYYKVVGGKQKKYYPSNSSTADGEKVYYISEPVNGAQRDDSTRATAYKWYYTTNGQTTNYVSESPSSGATKTDKTKTLDWTSWDSKSPAEKSYRKIESRVKVKIQKILGTSDENWKDLTTDYVTEEEMIKAFVDAGYSDITSLADLVNYKDLRYKVKLLIRNKKEVSINE